MGIDNNSAKFLFAARAAGVSFQNVATLGRQNFSPDTRELQGLLKLGKRDLSADRLLADSHGYAEKFFEFLGAKETTAIDHSDYEGAQIVTDLNAPIAPALKNRFSAIFDGGCLEHVFNFPQAIANCMAMLRPGGHFLGVTPANNYCGHGFYQFSPELFFRVFAPENGFLLRALLIKEKAKWYRVIDPRWHRGRVELLNTRPTCLFVLAQKTEERAPFAQPPQQSDYVEKWESEGQENSARNSRNRTFQQRLRELLPAKLKESLRPLAANLPIRFRSECYRELAELELLGGKLTQE